MSETATQNLGYTWCDQCGTYVPDVFTDHAERHKEAGHPVVVERESLIFWAFCVAAGVIAALAVVIAQ